MKIHHIKTVIKWDKTMLSRIQSYQTGKIYWYNISNPSIKFNKTENKILEKEYQKTLIPTKTPNPSEEKGLIIAYLYPTTQLKNGDYKELLNKPVGQGQGSFEWLDENHKNYWIEHSNNPDLLFFCGKYYKYGPNGYRKSTLNELANGETPEVDNPVPSIDNSDINWLIELSANWINKNYSKADGKRFELIKSKLQNGRETE